MSKSYQISTEEVKKIREIMKQTKNKNTYRRLETIALRGEGKKNHEIAEITKYHAKRVSQLVSEYCTQGLDLFIKEKRVGGNHRNMTLEEEKELLSYFFEKAKSGQIITVGEMKAEYDKRLNRTTPLATFYFLLKRHGWRKIMPRSKHPNKASDEAIEASKKLTKFTQS